MDNNFQNYGLPQLNLNPFVAQYSLTALNAQGLTFQISPNIEISPSYGYYNTPLSWQVSIDQHALRFYISEQVSTTGAVQYLLKLVGTLNYNVALLGLEPVEVVQGDRGIIALASNGSYMLDYTVGLFNSIAEVQSIILSSFSISTIIGQVSVVGPDGEVITFDPANPQPFYDTLNGDQQVVVNVNVIVVITFGDQPVS